MRNGARQRPIPFAPVTTWAHRLISIRLKIQARMNGSLFVAQEPEGEQCGKKVTGNVDTKGHYAASLYYEGEGKILLEFRERYTPYFLA
jgi:hypothetical protein